MTTTVYLWRANQSEPDCDGALIDVTHSRDTPPANPKPLQYENGLVDEESLYDDWRLIGEVDTEDGIMNNHLGDNFVIISGQPYFPSDVYTSRRYRSIKP